MLTIDIKHENTVSTLKLEGIIDLSTYQELIEALESCLQTGRNEIVLDMDEVFLFDSTGIGELFYFMNQNQIDLTLINIPTVIEETLEIMGFFDAIQQIKDARNSK